jgi:serine/threonine protein kinase
MEPPPVFRKADQEFYGTITKNIGSGGYGEVFLTEKGFVVKKMENTVHRLGPNLREIVYACSVRHPSIIRYQDVFFTKNNVYVYMAKADNDLSKVNLSRRLDGVEQFKKIALQCITTVAYLNSRNILHRDIKPHNFLYKRCLETQDGLKIFLADFGLAIGRECLIPKNSREVYTSWYRPPELLTKFQNYTEKSEVWALGCTLYQIFTGQPLFYGEKEEEILLKIKDLLGTDGIPAGFVFPRIIQPDINDLLSRMLQPNPMKRDDIYVLQHHPIFNYVTRLTSCYSIVPAPTNTCFDKIEIFERHLDYSKLSSGQFFTPRMLTVLLTWLAEVRIIEEIRPEAYILAIQTILRYLCIVTALPKDLGQLLGVAALYLSEVFLDFTATPLTLYSDLCANTYTPVQIFKFSIHIAQTLNYDLLATTPMDRLDGYSEKYRLAISLAKDILIMSSMLTRYFTRPDIHFVCLAGALNFYDRLPKELEFQLPIFREMFSALNTHIEESELLLSQLMSVSSAQRWMEIMKK